MGPRFRASPEPHPRAGSPRSARLSLTEDCAALDAFSVWYDSLPFVFLTRHKSAERGRWDAAHELAHLVLHLDLPPKGREHEQEADAFAAEFLMPQAGVLASAPRFPALIDARQEKLQWGVSTVAYIRRLHDLGVIPERRYRSLVIEASQAGYRRAEDESPRESSQLMPKVLELLRSDGITVADVARSLEISTSELRGLVFSPLSALDGDGEAGPAPRRHLRAI